MFGRRRVPFRSQNVPFIIGIVLAVVWVLAKWTGTESNDPRIGIQNIDVRRIIAPSDAVSPQPPQKVQENEPDLEIPVRDPLKVEEESPETRLLDERGRVLDALSRLSKFSNHCRPTVDPLRKGNRLYTYGTSTKQILDDAIQGLSIALDRRKAQPQEILHIIERVIGWVNGSKRTQGAERPSRPNPFNVAICMTGQFRVRESTSRSFRRYVFDVLHNPDLFLELKELNVSEIPDVAPAQDALVELAKQAHITDEDFNYTKVVERGGYSKCLDAYQNEGGANWNGGWPNAHPNHKTAMHAYYANSKCGETIRQSERERNRTYDWIILSRSDHVHLGAHLMLDTLNPSQTYIPYGMDWGGTNDRHAIHPRKHADVRFDIHEKLMNGTFPCHWLTFHNVNAELFLTYNLRGNGVPVNRCPPRSYLACMELQCQWGRQDAKYIDEIGMAHNEVGQNGWRMLLEEIRSRLVFGEINC